MNEADRIKRNSYAKRWYAKNKERINEKSRSKVKTKEQKDSHNRASRLYYQKNKQYYTDKVINRLKDIRNDEEKYKLFLEKKREYRKLYRLRNIDKAREYDKKRYEKRKGQRSLGDQKNRVRINNTHNLYIKKRFDVDGVFKMNRNISKLIRISIKRNGYKKTLRASEILSITPIKFKMYIESRFETWMNWNNYAQYNGKLQYGWDLDHIIPVSSASTEEEVIRMNHYTNFQPLDSYINRYIKRDRYFDI